MGQLECSRPDWQLVRFHSHACSDLRSLLPPTHPQAFKCGKTCFLCGVKPSEMAFSKNTYCAWAALGGAGEARLTHASGTGRNAQPQPAAS